MGVEESLPTTLISATVLVPALGSSLKDKDMLDETGSQATIVFPKTNDMLDDNVSKATEIFPKTKECENDEIDIDETEIIRPSSKERDAVVADIGDSDILPSKRTHVKPRRFCDTSQQKVPATKEETSSTMVIVQLRERFLGILKKSRHK
ncbi:unnamed protein product [Arabis nemorensis]|uniref:Uncharacterized protein n=1 Tax=Arabis nemorensis TaxID=586526 RepID=A0A565BLJ1_9BRAS|nr:unnamed protein product [Arabis nemorensis]